MTRVKICGITQLTDALFAAECGADALGFIFAESPRRVSADTARDIIRRLPPFITTIGVFVGQQPDLPELTQYCGFSAVQLHSGYSREYVAGLRSHRLILGVRVKDQASLGDIPGVEMASAVLLDAWHPQLQGGSGLAFDWSILHRGLPVEKPFILAGGLNPENISEAVEKTRPYAVDVSSGVEVSPGIKDPEKVRLFIERVKARRSD